jgi:hypothetical protein
MNIESIGGWNVWFFIVFWMLSQCILVHHARRGSKQPDSEEQARQLESRARKLESRALKKLQREANDRAKNQRVD